MAGGTSERYKALVVRSDRRMGAALLHLVHSSEGALDKGARRIILMRRQTLLLRLPRGAES